LFFLPPSFVPLFAWAATIAETVLAALLIFGIRPRESGIAAAALLLSFALTMTLALGIKKPLDYSVFAAAGAALLTAFPPQRRNNTGV
jgi:hypothetical protein